jgi:hypothetical protein
MNWEQTVVQRTLEGAGKHTAAQLIFLLRRLEAHPDALPAIAATIRDMAEYFARQADALEAEGRRRDGGAEVIRLQRAQERRPE